MRRGLGLGRSGTADLAIAIATPGIVVAMFSKVVFLFRMSRSVRIRSHTLARLFSLFDSLYFDIDSLFDVDFD